MKNEPTTIQELRGMARYVNREFDNLCRVEGLILDRAAYDPGIHLMELKEKPMSNLTFFFVLLGVCTFTRGLFWVVDKLEGRV